MSILKQVYEVIREYVNDVDELVTHKIIVFWLLGVFIASNIYAAATLIQWAMK